MTTATQERPKVTATGKSGTTYTFTVYDLATTFRPIGGVYLFLKNRNPVYVGQTGDLSTRFDNHHKASEITRNGASCIAVLVVGHRS